MLQNLRKYDEKGQYTVASAVLAKNIMQVCDRLQQFTRFQPLPAASVQKTSNMLSAATQVLNSITSSGVSLPVYVSLPGSTRVYDNDLQDILMASAAFKLKYDTDQ